MSTAALLKQAQRYCDDHGLQLTAPRRHVLKIVADSKAPAGAYDILEKLARYHDDPKPPTVYRALEFLEQHGFIHRIESLNAYVTCHAGHRHKGAQFMVCDSCGGVEEAHVCAIPDSLAAKMKKEGFAISYWKAELHGLCKTCRS